MFQTPPLVLHSFGKMFMVLYGVFKVASHIATPTLSLSPQTYFLSGPPLWLRGNIFASHLVGPASIPGRVNFPGWRFFWVFSSTVWQMSGKLRLHPSLDVIGYHNHKKSFITGTNVLRCWHALKCQHFLSVNGIWLKSYCMCFVKSLHKNEQSVEN